jgi:hypothetical protein
MVVATATTIRLGLHAHHDIRPPLFPMSDGQDNVLPLQDSIVDWLHCGCCGLRGATLSNNRYTFRRRRASSFSTSVGLDAGGWWRVRAVQLEFTLKPACPLCLSVSPVLTHATPHFSTIEGGTRLILPGRRMQCRAM